MGSQALGIPAILLNAGRRITTKKNVT